jgi:GNAT superfamily N-acetyltransferase
MASMKPTPLPMKLADSLPDLPRWVETRWLLQVKGCKLLGHEGGQGEFIVIHPQAPFGAVVGRPPPRAFERLRARRGSFELIGQAADAAYLKNQLPDWDFGYGLIHTKPLSEHGPGRIKENSKIVVQSPPSPELLAELPKVTGKWGAVAFALAAWLENERPVSVCAAVCVTESYWDVGIKTVEQYRRRGYARVCFEVLERFMAERGKRAVWSADERNRASLAMARRLDFSPVDRLVVLEKRA